MEDGPLADFDRLACHQIAFSIGAGCLFVADPEQGAWVGRREGQTDNFLKGHVVVGNCELPTIHDDRHLLRARIRAGGDGTGLDGTLVGAFVTAFLAVRGIGGHMRTPSSRAGDSVRKKDAEGSGTACQ